MYRGEVKEKIVTCEVVTAVAPGSKTALKQDNERERMMYALNGRVQRSACGVFGIFNSM